MIEVPIEMISAIRGIWAERLVQDGTRQRIGSPFLSELLARDPGLAEVYHAISPENDRELLMPNLAAAITLHARNTGSVGDPEGHGWRVAGLLLPDVLRYGPRLPTGFTFAGQNGRHPTEAAEDIIATILGGVVAPHNRDKVSHRLQEQFPYFATSSKIT